MDEDPWRALLREIREESGYDIAQLKLLQPPMKQPVIDESEVQLHPWPVSVLTHKFTGLEHYHTDVGYAFTVAEDPAHNVAADESQEFRALTRSELAALADDEIPPNVRSIALILLDDYVKNWRQITPPHH